VNDMKISTRLMLAFGLLGLLIALVGGVGLWTMSAVNAQATTALRDRYPKVQRFHAIKADNELIARALRNALLMTDAGEIAQQLATVAQASKRVDDQVTALKAIMSTPAGIAIFARLDAARNDYDVLRDKDVALIKGGQLDEARTLLMKDVRPKQLAYMAVADELIELGSKLMGAAADQADAEARTAWQLVIGSLVLSLAIAFAMGLAIVRAITRPLNKAVAVARGVAAGDLSMQIDARGSNETAQLLTSLKEMQGRLHAIVQGARHTAESVATASAQIASGNSDLSSRTEQQASALQQTAASMEQLGGTVRANADSAQQANQLALAASGVASQGGQAVGEVVETMRLISDSSQRIADIIGVIDGIAFQTNILALNAAVEAARAGEQGRGFAVVAGEVRALAQRSAEAAKEIKTLITASTERVEQGTAQVGRAGATIQEVVGAIRRVTDIVGEISAASVEQSSGVAQIGQAVTQMDQATQQNAALVEESAAAAESLKGQAAQLVQAMAVFKLDARTHQAPAAAPATAPLAKPAVAARPAAARAPVAAKPKPTVTPKPAAPAPAPAPVAAAASDDWESF